MNAIPLEHGLALAAVLFSLGLIGLMVRRNILFVLMSLEVMMNATALAFVVAGSRWGSAPLLTREQAHDRALAREFDFEARAAELADARRRQRHGGAA